MRFLPVKFNRYDKDWIMFMREKTDALSAMAELFDLSELKFNKILYRNLKEAQDAWKHEVSSSRLKLFAVPLEMSGTVCNGLQATGITMIPEETFKRFMFVDPENGALRLADIDKLLLKITIS